MGRVKTKDIKTISKSIFENRRELFSADFGKNNQALKESGAITEKKMRNRIAGYLVRLSKQQERE